MIVIRSVRLALAIAAVAGSLALARTSAAQTTADAADQAAQLFDRGNALYKEGHWADAEVQFQKAWDLRKSFDLAANLGDCELEIGQSRKAAEHLAYAVKEFPLSGKTALRERLQKRFAEARARVGALKVQVSLAGAEVVVDGRRIGLAPLADEVFVEPGPIVVEVKLAGYLDGRQQVVIAKGDERSVTVALVPLPTQHRSIVPGVVLGSIAGAALAGGIGSFVAARGKRSSAQSLSQSILDAHHSCFAGAANFDARCDQVSSTASAGNALEHAAAGLFAGAGAAAVGAVVYFVWPQASTTPPKSGRWRIAPALSPSALGLSASGTF